MADLTWEEFRDVVPSVVGLLPLGAVEQHGPHLPLDTDTVVPRGLCLLVADRVPAVVVPPFAYGYKSQPTTGGGGTFAGTTNFDGATFTACVRDVVRELLRQGMTAIALINGNYENSYFAIEGIDLALREAASTVVEDPNGRIVELGDGYELLGVGYANETPWRCPRDVTEDELASHISRLADQVTDPARAIFSLHVPPYGSGLDVAPRLDEQFRVVMAGHGPEMIPVGSTAVRDAILRYQPVLGLHGHIHESKGVQRIGRSVVVNPGSEYAEGVLDGALIDLDPVGGITGVQLVSG